MFHIAGWSSPVARRAHNPKVVGSNPAPATKKTTAGFVGCCFLNEAHLTVLMKNEVACGL